MSVVLLLARIYHQVLAAQMKSSNSRVQILQEAIPVLYRQIFVLDFFFLFTLFYSAKKSFVAVNDLCDFSPDGRKIAGCQTVLDEELLIHLVPGGCLHELSSTILFTYVLQLDFYCGRRILCV